MHTLFLFLPHSLCYVGIIFILLAPAHTLLLFRLLRPQHTAYSAKRSNFSINLALITLSPSILLFFRESFFVGADWYTFKVNVQLSEIRENKRTINGR